MAHTNKQFRLYNEVAQVGDSALETVVHAVDKAALEPFLRTD
jgi:hypothetical protein